MQGEVLQHFDIAWIRACLFGHRQDLFFGPRQDLKLHVFCFWARGRTDTFFVWVLGRTLTSRARVYMTGPIPFFCRTLNCLVVPRQDLKLPSSCLLDRTDMFFVWVRGRTLNCRVRVHLIHRFKKGDRSHIRCYVCNNLCTGVAVPIIRHSVSLHIYPQVHAPWACRMCEWTDRRPQMGFYIQFHPS